jgi:hypothetical protein
LTQRENFNRQVLNSPLPKFDGIDWPQPNFSLSTCEGAFDRAKLRHTKLFGEVRVEGDYRTSGIDEKSDVRTAVYLHADEGQRVDLREFDTGWPMRPCIQMVLSCHRPERLLLDGKSRTIMVWPNLQRQGALRPTHSL